MKKFALMLLSIAVLGMLPVEAQVKRITGTIISTANGNGIPGVSIVVKGTTLGTITNIDGDYQIDVPEDAENLIFSFVGMKTVERPIEGSVMNVYMESEMMDVDEVVVVAYGTAKKQSFTGSASTVKGEKLARIQTSNISRSLEGNVAGVQIATNSGQPGDGASIIVRGIGSISAGQAPLIVVDGVPYEGSLNSIVPQDIETLTVLKDAASNSMYGARGSNGVILITTKTGEAGKTRVGFDAKYGWNSRAVPSYDVITNAGDYYETMWESLRNSYYNDSYGYMESNYMATNRLIDNTLYYNVYDVPNNQLVNPHTGQLNPDATERKWPEEWTNVPFKSGKRQEYNLNFSGATEQSSYYSSVGYLGDEGYINGSDFERISARVKVEQKITDFFKAGANLAYSGTTRNTAMDPDNLSAYSNIFSFSQQIAPIYPVYQYDMETGEPILDEVGNKTYDFGTTYGRPYGSEQNPVSTMQDNLNEFKTDNISSRGFMELSFLRNFRFTANLAYDVFNLNNTMFDTPNGGDAQNVGGRGYKTSEQYTAINTNQLINYNKEFGSSEISLLVGHEIKKDETRYLLGHMTNFVNSENPEFANATVYQELTSYKSEYALEGYFSRLEYDFMKKYYLSGSFRYDGSSRFAPDVRWGSFWSVGASWRISQENFMQGVNFIDNLKLKASYGTQGNDNIGTWYAYKDLYEVNRVDDSAAMNLKFRGNNKLTWEKSENLNAGIETGIFGKITLNADFFIKSVTDMLYRSPLASSLGNPSFIWRNEMDMKNTGFELDLGIELIRTSNLNWTLNLNGTHYKNELTRLPATKDQEEGYQAGLYWREIGGSIYQFYTYEYAGVDPAKGLPLFNMYTVEEDGTETVETVYRTSDASLRKTGKSAIPDFYGGIGSSINAFGFDFSFQTAYQIGGYIMDSGYQELMGGGEAGNNWHKDIYKRWNIANTVTDVPAVFFENQNVNDTSTRWLTDASYFNVRNVVLGYTFPSGMNDRLSISTLRIYVVADNIWYVSARKGLDTRQHFNGETGFNYSALRTVSFGVSLGL